MSTRTHTLFPYTPLFRARAEKLQIQLPNGRRLGGVVIEADHVSKGYGDRLLIEDLTFKLPPAGIVGVIGPNGAGKTTLFRMITGEEKPDSGTFKVGETVDLAYLDQSREDRKSTRLNSSH